MWLEFDVKILLLVVIFGVGQKRSDDGRLVTLKRMIR
jgi:hypothetical protein